ncbi:RNA polymerase sigma factor [Tunicatimonas pelagia]|uniref:RNA polymerase sigma factor n=1 Tax=Tunicatimonas pelagia TaxID=931531 RepID=UPI0026658149|nr:hypothetical protein [Tunicatimonas pelagia]WKN44081.1 hypothetical protein P0M28_03755 [Tunicatimonas pelagia]
MPHLIKLWKEQLQQGNTQILETLFVQHGPYCLRRLQQLGCAEPDAEDLLQDAVLVFRHNLLEDKLHHRNNLRGYLYLICCNLYRTRQQQAQATIVSFNEALIRTEPEMDVAGRQEALRIFQQLSSQCQEIIGRYYVDQQSMREIAQDMHFANTDVAKATKFRCVQRWLNQLQQLRLSHSQRRPV